MCCSLEATSRCNRCGRRVADNTLRIIDDACEENRALEVFEKGFVDRTYASGPNSGKGGAGRLLSNRLGHVFTDSTAAPVTSASPRAISYYWFSCSSSVP